MQTRIDSCPRFSGDSSFLTKLRTTLAHGLDLFNQMHFGKLSDESPQWHKQAGYQLKCMLMKVRLTDERASNGDKLPGWPT